MKVDFPQPDGPMMAIALLAAMSRLMPCKTRFSPNQAETSRATNFAPASAFGSVSASAISGGPFLQAVAQGNRESIQEQHGHQQDHDTSCRVDQELWLRPRH